MPSSKLPALIATASILQISESMLPHPVPGLRFGLANIVSLIVLYRYGFRAALTVTLMRSVITAFIMGSFLSPGFVLSFTGGCTSMCVMGLIHRFTIRFPFVRISPIGLGMAGAFTHNMIQVLLAYLILIQHPGIFFLAPWLSFGSVVLGAISGGLTAAVLNQLDRGAVRKNIKQQPVAPLDERMYQPGNSWLHCSTPESKIAGVLAVTLTAVFVQNLYLYGVIFIFILVLIPSASLSYISVFSVLRRLRFVILSASLLPLYFNAGSRVLVDTPVGPIHLEAVISACEFSSRIAILALVTNIVAQTTSSRAFAAGIRNILSPLDRTGFKSDAIAGTISDSLTVLPKIWTEIRSLIVSYMAEKRLSLHSIKVVVIQILIHLFSKSDQSRYDALTKETSPAMGGPPLQRIDPGRE